MTVQLNRLLELVETFSFNFLRQKIGSKAKM